ncbi:hypothetical protein [Paenibacillus lautus]|uniref:hypothetical protein n=1 Tax=Paenibacillus lautus TaxID=1401 RepID=UPI003D2AFA7A
MKQPLNIIPEQWKRTGIVTIGGLLIGAGFADCLIAMNSIDLNQIARGLTIFSAGLTILVVMDNSKTQKQTEKLQKETQLRMERIEDKLNALHQSQQITNSQFLEIKELMHQSNSEI